MCREAAVLELTAQVPGVQLVQMWVCDLVMSQTFFEWIIENGELRIMANVVEEKSFLFAIRIVRLYQYLHSKKKEFVLSKQLLRSGTSIGANVAEAQQAQSRADFLSKINIALKEAAETEYWLRLLRATDYMAEKEFRSIYDDCEQVKKPLVSIVKSTKE